MSHLDRFLDERLASGRAYFSRDEAVLALGLTQQNFMAAAGRLTRKQRLASPKRGFFLILRPEDRVSGAPDPVRWIDPLMRYLGVDYRVSLLRAAAFHGSSHQAAMVFQVIAPRQLRDLEIGRHRIQFFYQAPAAFAQLNQAKWTDRIKSEAGFANVAGVELTLLDAARYFHEAAGINGVAQIAKDLGGKANPRKLASAAVHCENASVRRLGYLLDIAGHARQAEALVGFVRQAKSLKLLNPSAKPLFPEMAESYEKNARWKLIINETIEVDF